MAAVEDRVVKAETFPLGIDYARFREATQDPQVDRERQKLTQVLGKSKLIFSVDRLDYSKGLLHRLLGFEHFLERYPQWHGRIVFNMVVVPSRESVGRYQEMKKEIEARVKAMPQVAGVVNEIAVAGNSSYTSRGSDSLTTSNVKARMVGNGKFSVEEATRPSRGTSVTLHLKPADPDNGLEDFTSEWPLSRIVKKYSDFITYPIRQKVSRERVEEDEHGEPKKDGKQSSKAAKPARDDSGQCPGGNQPSR